MTTPLRIDPRRWWQAKGHDLPTWAEAVKTNRTGEWLRVAHEWYKSPETRTSFKRLAEAKEGTWEAALFTIVMVDIMNTLRSSTGPREFVSKSKLIYRYDETRSEWVTEEGRDRTDLDTLAKWPEDVPHGHRRWATENCDCTACKAGHATEAKLKGLRGRPSPRLVAIWYDMLSHGAV